MRETLVVEIPNLTPEMYMRDYLLSSSHLESVLSENKGFLQEWTQYQKYYEIRYKIPTNWSPPVKRILKKDSIIVNEIRVFSAGAEWKTSSTCKTEFSFLSFRVDRTLRQSSNGCTENIEFEVNYTGSAFKDQIEADFAKALIPFVFPSNSKKTIEKDPMTGLVVPPKESDLYISLHHNLSFLKERTSEYSKYLEESKPKRNELMLPSISQLEQIVEYSSPGRFSIERDIDRFEEQANKTRSYIEQLKEARTQTASSNSLPIFVLAAFASVIFIVVSK